MDRAINSVDVGGSVQDFVYKMCFHVVVYYLSGFDRVSVLVKHSEGWRRSRNVTFRRLGAVLELF